MAIRVIGAGFGRTGTLSLKLALEKLGFDRCYHMLEVQQNPSHAGLWSQAHAGESIDWDALFEGYQASVDWPSCNLWREQLEHFPAAKVLLSLRDSERWYDSVMNTIYKTTAAGFESHDAQHRARAQWAADLIWNRVFDGRMEDREHVIGVYERHNQDVIDSVAADRLLVFQASEGWEPLCKFLEVDRPDEDYPRVNTSEQFNERWAKS
jgi:hypothetical protein